MQSRNPQQPISSADTMVSLVERDFNIIPILSRFSIPLGFGNMTIGEVCSQSSIDTDTFLLIVNFILSGKLPSVSPTVKAAIGIVDFLHNSHNYFLQYKFPHIRANLLNALDATHDDINPAIISFFDQYVEQVRRHFDYEETNVWPYIHSLGNQASGGRYNIETFRKHHDEVGEKLSDLKNIILRYYSTSKPNRMYDVLVDIFTCEEDLNSHTDIENHILIPMISAIEQCSANKSREQ